MDFDPSDNTQSILSLIKNDTLVDTLDQDQLSESLKHITLNVDDSLYILDKVQSKYNVSDRFMIIRNIYTDFGEDCNFDSHKFVEFIRGLSRCLKFYILDDIANIVDSAFSKDATLSSKIKQNPQEIPTASDIRTQTQEINKDIEKPKSDSKIEEKYIVKSTVSENDQISAEDEPISQNTAPNPYIQMHTPMIVTAPNPYAQTFVANKNIEALQSLTKTEDDFDEIYKICEQIARKKDREAMLFAVRENFVYVKEKNTFSGNMQICYDGNNVLTKAVLNDNQNLIRILIDSNIDINTQDIKGRTALVLASAKGNYKLVNLLLSVPGVDVNSNHYSKYTPLIFSSWNGHLNIVELLLNFPGIDVNAETEEGATALVMASKEGRDKIVKKLLTFPEINVNAIDNKKRTALMWASLEGQEGVVKKLLTFPGINVNLVDSDNKTALMWAKEKKYHKIIKMLKDHGAK